MDGVAIRVKAQRLAMRLMEKGSIPKTHDESGEKYGMFYTELANWYVNMLIPHTYVNVGVQCNYKWTM